MKIIFQNGSRGPHVHTFDNPTEEQIKVAKTASLVRMGDVVWAYNSTFAGNMYFWPKRPDIVDFPVECHPLDEDGP
jgi:hypothetical protein